MSVGCTRVLLATGTPPDPFTVLPGHPPPVIEGGLIHVLRGGAIFAFAWSGIVEGCDIGSEPAFAARERHPVIGKIGEVHAYHQRSLVDLDKPGLGPYSLQRARGINRPRQRAVARRSGGVVKGCGGVPE